MISLRSIAIILGMLVFAFWGSKQVGIWTWLISVPLCFYAGRAAGALDHREGRWS